MEAAGARAHVREPGDPVYEGMIVGIHSRDNDLVVNPIRTKQSPHPRLRQGRGHPAHAADRPHARVRGRIHRRRQLVEITPKSIRLRKRHLKEHGGAAPSARRVTSTQQPIQDRAILAAHMVRRAFSHGAGLMSLALAACASAPVARVDSRGAARGSGVEDGRQALSLRWSTPAKVSIAAAVQYSFGKACLPATRSSSYAPRPDSGVEPAARRPGVLQRRWRRNSHVGSISAAEVRACASLRRALRTESLDLRTEEALSEARRV